MKIVSWNVNGLRAVHNKGIFLSFLKSARPDILCIQEMKADEKQLPREIAYIPGYFSYFSSSENKKGYSGVAVYTKIEPEVVEYGMGIKRFDSEGRILSLHFEDFILCNVYFPNGGMGPHRIKYKLEFYEEFLKYINDLRGKGKNIIFCGDVNTAHREIDLARPKENNESTGFLPEERAWLDKLEKQSWVDTFRHFYPDKREAYTYWDLKTRARDRNVGWRIDYFFANKAFIKNIKKAFILDEVYGSDHCPVGIDVIQELRIKN